MNVRHQQVVDAGDVHTEVQCGTVVDHLDFRMTLGVGGDGHPTGVKTVELRPEYYGFSRGSAPDNQNTERKP